MYKKLIFVILSFFYCANIASSNQLANNADEQLKTLLSIDNEIQKLSLNSETQKKVDDAITKYLISDKSLNSYLFNLKKLKNIFENLKYSTASKFLYSTLFALFSSGYVYYLIKADSPEDITYISKDNIKKGEDLYVEFKKATKELNFDKDSLEKIIIALDNIRESNWLKKIMIKHVDNNVDSLRNALSLLKLSELGLIGKSDEEIKNAENFLDTFREGFIGNTLSDLISIKSSEEISSDAALNLKTRLQESLKNFSLCLENAKKNNSTYVSIFTYPFATGFIAFASLYALYSYENNKISTIEKLIDEAIQDAELTLNNI